VVQVFDSGEWEGRPYLVMERLSGRTLANEMAAGPLQVGRVKTITSDVLGALAAAHSAGIVHRDVKPGNILIAADGSVKVSDFGIAKADPLLGGDVASSTMTGQVLGTPSYLAPERLAGRPATARSDLWSLGVVCWEALAGRRAYPEGSALAVAMAVMNNDLAPVASVRPDVDDGLALAIDGALRRDPEARWASAMSMRDALLGEQAPLAETTTVAAPPPPRPRTTVVTAPAAVSRRALPTAGWLTALAVLLVAAIAVVAALLIRQRGSLDPNRSDPPTSSTVATTSTSTTLPTTTSPPAPAAPIVTVPATPPPTTPPPPTEAVTTVPATTAAPSTSIPPTTTASPTTSLAPL
ncbi:MAG: serine/threonine protein kinase, partial [Chloroflexi bacterium]|nr:serine/threonine protein kinase [Chloroflexota bacterium]